MLFLVDRPDLLPTPKDTTSSPGQARAKASSAM